MKKIALTLLATFGFSFQAQADQCALVERSFMEEAAEIIKKDDTVAYFCNLCGDTEPTLIEVEKVEALEDWYWDTGLYFLVLNDDKENPKDLAYTFVRQKGNIFQNLAKLVGCPAEGVPDLIKIESTEQSKQ